MISFLIVPFTSPSPSSLEENINAISLMVLHISIAVAGSNPSALPPNLIKTDRIASITAAVGPSIPEKSGRSDILN